VQAHRGAIDREVHVAHYRTLFDLGPLRAARAPDLAQYLLDHQLDGGPVVLIAEHADVFEAHQCCEDFTRVDKDEGASFLAHTSGLKRLCSILDVTLREGAPR